jgi:hypothetical protein
VHEGCDKYNCFVFTVCVIVRAMLYMSAIYVYSYVCLFTPSTIRQWCSLEEIFCHLKYLFIGNTADSRIAVVETRQDKRV